MPDLRAPTLLESIALGGASCVFTVNFTHPIETVKKNMNPSGLRDGDIVLLHDDFSHAEELITETLEQFSEARLHCRAL